MILRLVIAVVVLALLGGAIVGFNIFRDQAIDQYFATMSPPPVTVSTVTIEPGPWTPGIETIGTVSAAQGVDLTVETTGIVGDILFKANQRVAKGDVLVQLDDAAEQADLTAEKAQLELTQRALTRADDLRQRQVGSAVAADVARAAANASAARVQRLEALVDQKKVLAPFGGTIGIPQVDLGQYVAPGAIIATLQDIDSMRVDFTIPEQRLNELKIGQPVELGVHATGLSFRGTISGIDPKVDPNSRLVSVRAAIDNPEGRLTPGQFVEVRVILPTEQDIISLPQTALVSSLYGDFVFVVRPAPPPAAPAPATTGEAVAAESSSPPAAGAAAPQTPKLVAIQVFVKPGRRAEGRVEITSGLSAGEQIVTAGQNRLFSGAPVVVDNTVDPSKAGPAR